MVEEETHPSRVRKSQVHMPALTHGMEILVIFGLFYGGTLGTG